MAIWAVVISQVMNFGVAEYTGNEPAVVSHYLQSSGVSVDTEVYYGGRTEQECEETLMGYVYADVATTQFKPSGQLDKSWNSWLSASLDDGSKASRTYRCLRIDKHQPPASTSFQRKSFVFSYMLPVEMQNRRILKKK